ncbi:hypothetical protein POSPLADRAFT_1049185 [Postia placenta MAD-698-R-SB12]|uniref:CCHC-type domain-containing protein n=1 Tax=Postia placenta MAD-698-R-SB12 TaxID=670580 RepID=A0A1X6MRN2_9APHY|nr:hypothetical protein POSPLADRAFT_1049185 [Postia placenta MAD-698-R-SB12]OSX59045.1 hypothetical protein POSPLADRAFT_1049185 [Postia placenta MAD-698-R-SB12]
MTQGSNSQQTPVPPPSRHWMFDETIKPSKFHHLLKLPHKLSPSNYLTWITMIESTLKTVNLFGYCTGKVKDPDPADTTAAARWKRMKILVHAILMTNMMEDIINQFDDGEDLIAHIAKMKEYHRNLILMSRNIDDELFACFLRISMPALWNYVFAALPDRYTLEEIERHMKDELGVRTNQQTNATVYGAFSKGKQKGKIQGSQSNPPKCTNCGKKGHTMQKCY